MRRWCASPDRRSNGLSRAPVAGGATWRRAIAHALTPAGVLGSSPPGVLFLPGAMRNRAPTPTDNARRRQTRQVRPLRDQWVRARWRFRRRPGSPGDVAVASPLDRRRLTPRERGRPALRASSMIRRGAGRSRSERASAPAPGPSVRPLIARAGARMRVSCPAGCFVAGGRPRTEPSGIADQARGAPALLPKRSGLHVGAERCTENLSLPLAPR